MENKEWELVKADGTIKRYDIPGGWIYATFDWVYAFDAGGRENSHWRMVSAFFVPHTR